MTADQEEPADKMNLDIGILEYDMNHSLDLYDVRVTNIQGTRVTTWILAEEMSHPYTILEKN